MPGLSEKDISLNLKAIRDEILHTCTVLGRKPPRLIAVSKTHSSVAVTAAYRCGQREFGENYYQELIQKKADLVDLPDLRFIFIGRLQSNKIKNIVTHADEIQSLANERHAELIARAARDSGRTPYPVYYLVNAGGEISKDGLSMDSIPEFHSVIAKKFPELSPQGLMAIPPPGSAPELYQSLRKLATTTGAGLLSLGMSSDLNIALTAGTDCVRIGTAIFGAREA